MPARVSGLRIRTRTPRRGFRIGAAFLGVLGLSSCNEESPTYLDPIYQVGALEGYVLVAGEPRSVLVGAREVGHSGLLIARTQSGPDGWYRLELPVDRYRIEINPGNYGFISSDNSDVVQVEPRTKRLDLLRGRLRLRVQVPESMQGFRLEAWPRSTRNVHPTYATIRIENPITEFTFDLLEPGTYRVWLTYSGGPRYWLPGTYDEDAAQQIAVLAEGETVVEAALSRYASLSGSVVGSWQQAASSVPYVEAYTMNRESIARTPVGADGAWRLHLFIAEPVKIRVAPFGGVEQWIGGSFESATVFRPQVGEDVRGIDWVESGIQVHLEGPGFFFGHRPRFLVTDGKGWEFVLDAAYLRAPYAITNLSPGRYYLHVSADCSNPQPWRPQWYAGAESLDGAVPIDLPAGHLEIITMQLEQGGAIEGQVLFDPAIAGVAVGIFDLHGKPLCEGFSWTENGKFNFPGLADGDYFLAVAKGDGNWWYPGTWSQSNASVIGVRNAQTVSGITWPLREP